MRPCIAAVALLLLISSVYAQTITTIDPNNGFTVVEVVTVDPVAETPTTEILRTITTTSRSSTTTSTSISTTPVVTTAPAAVNQGPVGQPAPTIPGGQTIFYYTTTNAAGETTQVEGIFTPTYNTFPPASLTSSGTVLDYSSWLSVVGTHTVAANQVSAGSHRWRIEGRWVGISGAVLVGMAGGAWLVVV